MKKVTIRCDPNKRNGKEYPRWIAQWRVNGKIKTVYLGSCAKVTEAEAQAKAEQLKYGNGVTNVIPNTESKTVVWCSHCATKFFIPPTEKNFSQTCPNCGKAGYVHYMPVSPGTIKVPNDTSVRGVIGLLWDAWRKLSKSPKSRDEEMAKACIVAMEMLKEGRSAGVIEDLGWCPRCEGYKWDAKNQKYYYSEDDEIIEYAPGTACNINRG